MSDYFEWDDPEREPELGELLISRTEDGMIRIKARYDAEAATMINRAINHVAAELPRAPGTTDEQHLHDAFVELLGRAVARRATPQSAT
jgi:Domain of unknown function (DUF222)